MHDGLVRDAGAQVGDVADDAHGAAALAQPVEHGEHLLEAVVVEAAEALVDEQRAEVEPAGLLAHRVGQAQGQGQRGHEGLAARQRGGVADPAGPLVEHPQAQAGPGAAGGSLVGVLEQVAPAAHDGESLVGQRRHRLEARREHVGGQPHPQGVVGADAAGGVGELAHPGVALGAERDASAGLVDER